MHRKLKIVIALLFLVTGFKRAEAFVNPGDTISVFKATNLKKDKLLSFDDNNSLTIKYLGVKMVCKEAAGDDYNLLVTVKGKTVLSKKGIKGISKVLCENGYLTFAVFTYSDEDGNNEGYGYVINLNDNSVKMYPQKLKNTCNPVVLGNTVYFWSSEEGLLKTAIDLHLISTIALKYQSKSKSYRYLDTYAISGITIINGDLLIDFSPNKFKGSSKFYSGKVTNSTRLVVLAP